MDELVKLVASKVGISSDQAEKAVTTVLGFLKERLPEPVAGQLDSVIAGGSGAGGGLDLGSVEGTLGGLFGKQ
jgi:hypothetical protein